MKWMSLVVAAALAVGLVGCGGSNTAQTDDGKLTVTKPSDTTLKVGEDKTITVGIKRPDTAEDVTVSLSNLPSGVSVDKNDLKVAKGGTKAEFILKADKDAKEVENHVVTVASKYKDTTAKEEFKLSVKK